MGDKVRIQFGLIHPQGRGLAAVDGLLDLLEGRYDSAVYEAMHALSASEDAVLQMLGHAAP